MSTQAMIEAADLAAREASPTPWRAEGRRVLDARGHVIAEMRAEDEHQASRDAVAMAACVSLFAGDEDLGGRLLAAEEEAAAAEARANELHHDLENMTDDLNSEERERELAERDLERVRDQVRKAGLEPVA